MFQAEVEICVKDIKRSALFYSNHRRECLFYRQCLSQYPVIARCGECIKNIVDPENNKKHEIHSHDSGSLHVHMNPLLTKSFRLMHNKKEYKKRKEMSG